MEIERRQAAGGRIRKRKADSDGANERLSKVSRKLSLLNLERNASQVEIPSFGNPSTSNPSDSPTPPASTPTKPLSAPLDDVMQMDNTSHKVYIYNLDDELSDSDSSTSSDTDRLIFNLSDLSKHLRQSRIPPSILANADGELAGRNISNELVLYNVPSSLSVPEGQDNVRKAIIETRARAREKARREQEKARTAPILMNGNANGSEHASGQRPLLVRMDACATPGGPAHGTTTISQRVLDVERQDDPDAMDLD